MRVVSLTCSNTEIVSALGCAEQLVGVDDHSDFPVEVVSALPRVGPDLNIRVAEVAALRPDLVLASLTVPGHEKIVAALEEARIPFIAPEPVSLADTYRDIRQIAALLEVGDRGEALVAEMQEAMPQVEPPVAGSSDRPRVAVEWWPKPVIVPGRDSWVTDLIELAGGENPWGGEAVKSRAVEVEGEAGAVARDPQAMIISWCGVATSKYRPHKVYERSGWSSVAAVREQQVHCVAEAYLGRPGPRLVHGYRTIRAIVEGLRSTPLSAV